MLSLVSIIQMVVFASYNKSADFDRTGLLNVISFASIGQATNVCSKAVIEPDTNTATLLFSCSEDYVVSDIFSIGYTLPPKSDNPDWHDS